MSEDTWLARMEGLVAGILSMVVAFHVSGCSPKKDVEALKGDLAQCVRDVQVLNVNAAHSHALATSCREELTEVSSKCDKACGAADAAIHQMTEYAFELNSDQAVVLPCSGKDIRVGTHMVDLKNEWVYLSYFVEGEQRFTDPLWWGQGFPSDRNTIRIDSLDGTVTFVSVHQCSDKTTCKLSCFSFVPPVDHPKVCDNF